MQFIDATSTIAALPFHALIDALRVGFEAGCVSPEREHYELGLPWAEDSVLLSMPAWDKGMRRDALVGVKLVTVFPNNTKQGLSALESVYILFDGGTGKVLCMIDGNVLTARRTAATAALAASFLSEPDAGRLLVVGAGRVGGLLPSAYSAVRKIKEVEVWDKNVRAAELLVERLKIEGMHAKVVTCVEDSVREADIIGCATLSTEPIIFGKWVKASAHVDLIGSFKPTMREGDDELIVDGSIYIDIEEALEASGDLAIPLGKGRIGRRNVIETLTDLCKRGGRVEREEGGFTVFKTVGSALADLYAAKLVLKNCKSEGRDGRPRS